MTSERAGKPDPWQAKAGQQNLKFPSLGPGCTLLDLHDLLEFPGQMTGAMLSTPSHTLLKCEKAARVRVPAPNRSPQARAALELLRY